MQLTYSQDSKISKFSSTHRMKSKLQLFIMDNKRLFLSVPLPDKLPSAYLHFKSFWSA